MQKTRIWLIGLIAGIAACASDPALPPFDVPEVADTLPQMETLCEFPEARLAAVDGLEVVVFDDFDALETCQIEYYALRSLQATNKQQYDALVEQYNVLTELMRLRSELARYQLESEITDKRAAVVELWVTRALLLAVVAL